MADYLADTHTFLWYAGGWPKLSARAKRLIEHPANRAFLSVASVWEMAVKSAKHGAASLDVYHPGGFEPWFDEAVRRTGFRVLRVEAAHAKHVSRFTDPPHRDPFDHLIIAQGLVEELPVLGVDDRFDAYGVRRLW